MQTKDDTNFLRRALELAERGMGHTRPNPPVGAVIVKNGKIIGRAIDFMGFVFRRNRTVLRKKIMIRATRFAGRLKRTRKIATRQALSMMSRIGWFKHTSTSLVWKTYIEPCVNIKVLKGIISKAQKEAAHENTMDHRDGLRTLSGTVCSA